METRTLVVALIAILNFAVDTLEKLVTEGVVDTKPKAKAEEKKSRPARGKKKEEEEEEDEDDEDEDEDEDGEASEDDVVDAVRAAQKVLDRNDVAKLVKKLGKAERASAVKPENRQKLIDALAAAVEKAQED